jgi:hypothetical protein
MLPVLFQSNSEGSRNGHGFPNSGSPLAAHSSRNLATRFSMSGNPTGTWRSKFEQKIAA